jgi:predicted nucleic acid-binding protein
VCRRKLGLSWIEIEELVTMLKATCSIVPLTVQVHDLARAITRAHRIAFHDALIVSAAEAAGARTLYSEDLAHGQRFATVTVANPFLH